MAQLDHPRVFSHVNLSLIWFKLNFEVLHGWVDGWVGGRVDDYNFGLQRHFEEERYIFGISKKITIMYAESKYSIYVKIDLGDRISL